jgi:hypothetical protein
LASKGFEVEVLTTDPSGKLPLEEMINNVKVKRFRSWAPNEAYYFSPALAKAVRETDARIVHVTIIIVRLLSWLYCLRERIKNAYLHCIVAGLHLY